MREFLNRLSLWARRYPMVMVAPYVPPYRLRPLTLREVFRLPRRV